MLRRRAWIAILFLLAPAMLLAQEAKLTTVILVRHAEKQSDAGDPDLSTAGQVRAQDLVRSLGSAGITAIYTSQYLRTRRTAEPLAAFLKLKPVAMDASGSKLLVEDILAHHPGETVLVVGHSNTLPEIASILGAKIEPIGDMDYDNLYVVTVGNNSHASMVRLKFGQESR